MAPGSETRLLGDLQRLWLLCSVWRQGSACRRTTLGSLAACTVSQSLLTHTVPESTVGSHPVTSDRVVTIDL